MHKWQFAILSVHIEKDSELTIITPDGNLPKSRYPDHTEAISYLLDEGWEPTGNMVIASAAGQPDGLDVVNGSVTILFTLFFKRPHPEQ